MPASKRHQPQSPAARARLLALTHDAVMFVQSRGSYQSTSVDPPKIKVDRIKVAKFCSTRLRWIRQTGLAGRASSRRCLLGSKSAERSLRGQWPVRRLRSAAVADGDAAFCSFLLTGRESVRPLVSAASSAGPVCLSLASHAGAETQRGQRARETHRKVLFQPPAPPPPCRRCGRPTREEGW
jgi:hypothetical protein